MMLSDEVQVSKVLTGNIYVIIEIKSLHFM